MLSSCNLSVVFKGTCSTYQIYSFSKKITMLQPSSKYSRDKLAYIMHTVPSTLSSNYITRLVSDLRTLAGSLFVTGLAVDYYASFLAG
jgi:hypothetical protein